MIITLTIAVGLAALAYVWLWNSLNYFRRKGFAEDPSVLFFGSRSYLDLLKGKIPFPRITERGYEKFGNARMVGYYGFMGTQRFLVINDMELVKRVLIKDFDHFRDRRPLNLSNEANKYFMNMLTNMKGEEWKEMRKKLTPSFTTGKLKVMLPLIHQVGKDMNEYLLQFANDGKDVDVKDLMINYALDVIATTAFGISTNSFKEPENMFKDMVSRITQSGKYKPGFLTSLKTALLFTVPAVANWLNIKLLDETSENFLVSVIRSQIRERRKSGKCRKDIIDALVATMKDVTRDGDAEEKPDPSGKESRTKKLATSYTDEQMEMIVVSNALLLFFAGFDTTSTALTACIFYLGANPECQQKLFEEVIEAVEENGGSTDVDYAKIQSLEYLEMFFNESMRCFPSIVLERLCTKDYRVEGTDLVIEKDVLVQIPAPQIMKDSKYFPDPDRFDPTNFSADAKAERGPYSFLTFGHGPRNCVGMRFGYLGAKVALFHLVHGHKVLPSDRSKELRPEPGNFSSLPKDGVWVKFEKRDS